MKYILLVPDGMADEPVPELGGKTPMEAAYKPNMDALAQNGFSGMVQTIPDGMPPGSDIGNLSLLGYDPTVNFSGRAPLEAANMGVLLENDQVAFRCNLVTLLNGTMHDYSAGHISSHEASQIIDDLNSALGSDHLKFYAGKSYRHLMTVRSEHITELLQVKTVPPHDILEASTQEYLPKGPKSDFLLGIMSQARQLLLSHAVNRARAGRSENQATDIWLWGQGKRPELPTFHKKFGLNGAIISAVDLVNGIGRLAGLDVVNVPGATGYFDTDYSAKAAYAIKSLDQNDFVYVHVESPDEAGHLGNFIEKVKAIEAIDREMVSPMIQWAKGRNDFRILIAPDHPTPVAKRTHTHAPVCFLMSGAGIKANRLADFSERTAAQAGLMFTSGAQMVSHFLKSV